MKLQLSNPVEPMILMQGFGVNGEWYRKNGVNIKGHNGLDLKTFHGQPIYASHDGLGLYQVDAKGGHGVVVISNDKFDYEGGQAYFKTIYWHMVDPIAEPKFKSPLADKGAMPVKRGDIVGYADNTGLSTATHLHFAVKPVAKTGENLWTWGNIEQGNGYMGCIDPMPYLTYIEVKKEEPKEDEALKTQLKLKISILQKLIELTRKLNILKAKK